MEGELFGTINFVSPEARPNGFSQTELDLIEMTAAAIGRQLSLDHSAEQSSHALAWHRAVAQTVNDAVVHVDPDGTMRQRNDAAAALLEESGRLAMHASTSTGCHVDPENLPERVAIRKVGPMRAQLQGIREGEGRQWFLVNAAPVDEDSDGIPDGAVVVLQDVTPVRAIADAAEQTRDLLRAVLEASPEGVMAFRAVR